MGRALTTGLPPTSGRMREADDDFVVEELLAYEPCGEGTHRFFQIEKRGRTTFDVLRQIARTLGRKECDIGCAGLKDKHAVTRQWLSLEFATEDELRGLDIEGVSVLDVVPHKNKLKLGHLRGNRFVIVLRDVAPGDLERCERKIEVLKARGVPNAFGPQRFGNTGSTPELGRHLLRDDAEGFLRAFAGASESDSVASMLDNARDRMLRRALEAWAQRDDARDGLRNLPKRFLSLCVSSLQSAVFNEVLSRRLAEDAISIDHIVAGDIAFLHRNGACFAVPTEEEAIVAAPRAASFEISPSAPLPGPDCLRATGAVLETEDDVLAMFDVRHEDFGVRRPWGQKGGRRALRVPLEECRVAALEPTALELRFALPRGSFATAVTAELFG